MTVGRNVEVSSTVGSNAHSINREWYGTTRDFYPLPAKIDRLKELFPEIDTSYVPVLSAPTGSETMREVHERVQLAMDKLVQNLDTQHERVALFGHAASVICCVRALLGDWNFYVNAGTCSISKLERTEEGKWNLLTNGSTEHLSQGNLRSWMFSGDIPSYEVRGQ
jgi:transcription factor C subunit 7